MMKSWLFFSIATLLASISKAESGLQCEYKKDCPYASCENKLHCVQWYTTGISSCGSGYGRSNIEAKGQPLGSYCERNCNDDELKRCTADMCERYGPGCQKYQSASACSNTLLWCGGSVKVDEKLCTKYLMGVDVKYDETNGTCSLGSNTPSESAQVDLTVDVKHHTSKKILSMRCNSITRKGATLIRPKIQGYISNKAKEATLTSYRATFKEKKVPENMQKILLELAEKSHYCHTNENYIGCEAQPSTWEEIRGFTAETCRGADHPEAVEPSFDSKVEIP